MTIVVQYIVEVYVHLMIPVLVMNLTILDTAVEFVVNVVIRDVQTNMPHVNIVIKVFVEVMMVARRDIVT